MNGDAGSSIGPGAWLGAGVLAVAVAGLMIWAGSGSSGSSSFASDRINIVPASASPSSSPAILPPSASPASTPVVAAVVQAELLQAFPILASAEFACTAGQCELRATPRINLAGKDRDDLQDLYLGGLDAFMNENGYQPIAPIRTEETGPDETMLRLSVRRIDAR